MMLPIRCEVNPDIEDIAYVLSQANSREQAQFFDSLCYHMSKFNYCKQNYEINRSFEELRVSDKRRAINYFENLVDHLKNS